MSQTINVTLPRAEARATWRRNQNRVKFSPSLSLGPVSHTVIIAIMLAVLGLIYLTQITKTSTYGYHISDLTTQKEQLQEEQRDLEVETARLQALERVKQSNVARSLEDSKKAEYAAAN